MWAEGVQTQLIVKPPDAQPAAHTMDRIAHQPSMLSCTLTSCSLQIKGCRERHPQAAA